MNTLQQIRSGELKGATQIKLSCGLKEFPHDLYELEDSLEVLDLSVNELSSLPADFQRFSKLKILFCSENRFTELPSVLGQCENLEMIGFKSNQIQNVPEESLPIKTRWLILTNNKITQLPASIGNCYRLQKVALAGNKLRELPLQMAACKNLELLRISANCLDYLPEWLLNLPKLSWLAFSGNTFNAHHAEPKPLQKINWSEFILEEQLGEGASGNIYKALWPSNAVHKEVAIKVFKGEVTSDGFPEDEMQATIAAGTHPNLVGLLGNISEHPLQKEGLVMELIPPSYKNLGKAPSFKTCTRDTFNEGTVFSANQILTIAIQVADAANQLHVLGLMHGDLYAHNILMDENDHVLMGDFGAACFYEVNSEIALNLERIEVRAFACLLDDLLQHLNTKDKASSLAQELRHYTDELLTEKLGDRPLFKELLSRLSLMRKQNDKT